MQGLVKGLDNDFKITIACGNSYDGTSNKIMTPKSLAKNISKSSYNITQPGFNSIYESLVLNCITIILPAQNYGQHRFVEYIKEYVHEIIVIDWSDLIPNFTPSWEGFKLVDDSLKNSSSELIDKLVDLIHIKIKDIKCNKQLLSDIINRQNLLLTKVGL